jgi:hypothetical protein
MQTFSIERLFTTKDFLKGVAFFVGMVSLPILYDVFINPGNLYRGYYFVAAVLLLRYCIDKTYSRKVQQVTFDPFNGQIILTQSAPLRKPKNLILPLEAIHIEVERTTSKWLGNTFNVSFMKGKREAAQVSRLKDSFSESTLQEMLSTAEGYGLAIHYR